MLIYAKPSNTTLVVAQLCPNICDPMNYSMPGFPVLHAFPEFALTHVHWVGDVIQPSHPLSPLFPPYFNLFQHQGLFQWVSSWKCHSTELMLKHTQGGSLPSQMNAFIKLTHANINGGQRLQIWGQVWQRPDMNNSGWSRIEKNASELIVKPGPDGVFTE